MFSTKFPKVVKSIEWFPTTYTKPSQLSLTDIWFLIFHTKLSQLPETIRRLCMFDTKLSTLPQTIRRVRTNHANSLVVSCDRQFNLNTYSFASRKITCRKCVSQFYSRTTNMTLWWNEDASKISSTQHECWFFSHISPLSFGLYSIIFCQTVLIIYVQRL